MLSSGQLARQAGVGVETLRFYERKGLLRQPQRRASGYRVFPEQEVQRLRFIKRAQQLGFTLKDIHELLALWEDPDAGSSSVKAKALSKVAEIDTKLRDLQEMKDKLVKLSRTCSGKGQARECPILLSFASS